MTYLEATLFRKGGGGGEEGRCNSFAYLGLQGHINHFGESSIVSPKYATDGDHS